MEDISDSEYGDYDLYLWICHILLWVGKSVTLHSAKLEYYAKIAKDFIFAENLF
jgi:hypothetical protein